MYLKLNPCPKCCKSYLEINRKIEIAWIRCSTCGFIYKENKKNIIERWNQLDRPGKR